MPTSSAPGLRLGAALRYRRVLRQGRDGLILAVSVYLCGRSFSSGLPEVEAKAASPPPRLIQDGGNGIDGGDDGIAMDQKRAMFVDGHRRNYSSFPVFSESWVDGEVGRCHPTSEVYPWRKWGWGSNINRLLFTWAGQIYGGRTDVALDFTGTSLHGRGLDGVECHPGAPNTEQQLSGWGCLFKPMQHLCTFHEEDELNDFVAAKQNVELHHKAPHLDLSVNVSDKVAVPAALVNFIYSNLQPWFEEDIRTIIEEDELVSVRDGIFVAVHVRRGDKIRKEAEKVEVEEYFRAAVSAIGQAARNRFGIESVNGIWVSSDDATVLPEARELAASFFPNVRREKVVSISFRSVKDNTETIPTTTTKMTYERYVILHTELAMMSAADVFVGTFSSNIARLVFLVREGLGFPRNSTISVDDPLWHLGRRTRA